jgi:L1 cell adhesion molecule like protein
MVNLFAQAFKREKKTYLTTETRGPRRLLTFRRMVKCTPSYVTEASIEIHSLFKGIDINKSFIHTISEDLNKDIFCTIEHRVKKPFMRAEMDKVQIHEIVLTGGSTRIPKMQKLLQDFFNEKVLNNSIKPDETVAYGAAVQAAILAGVGKSEEVQDLL